MNSRLDRIKDWAALAKVARYSATTMARQCGVSQRQLERFFQTRRQTSPHNWLRELRMKRAAELISGESSLKQAVEELGYKDAAHFSHDFKDYFGITPGQYANQPGLALVKNQMSLFDNKCRG